MSRSSTTSSKLKVRAPLSHLFRQSSILHVEANWKEACEAFAQSCYLPMKLTSDQSEATFYDVWLQMTRMIRPLKDASVVDASGNPQLIKLGFAQAPTRH
jgi:hypothetical protein